jgi:hypothetical protein
MSNPRVQKVMTQPIVSVVNEMILVFKRIYYVKRGQRRGEKRERKEEGVLFLIVILIVSFSSFFFLLLFSILITEPDFQVFAKCKLTNKRKERKARSYAIL